MGPKKLTDEEINHFVENGYIVVKDCFDQASAQQWIDRAWVRFGYHRDNPTEWIEKRIGRERAR